MWPPPPGRGLSDSSEKDKQSGAAQKLRLGRLLPERLPSPQSGLSGLDSPPQTACSGLRPQRVRRARTPAAARCGPDPVAPGAVRTQAHLDRAAQLFLLTDMQPDRRAYPSAPRRPAPLLRRGLGSPGRLSWAARPQLRRLQPQIGLRVGSSRTEPPWSQPWPPGLLHQGTDRRMDGRTGAQAARGEAPAQGGDQDFLLRSCLISPPGRPLPRVPDREWGAPPGVGCPGSSPLSARRPVRPWETQLGSGRAGAHLGSGARALPSSSRGTAGTPRAKPAPPERRAGIPSAHSSAQGYEEAKASEARSDFGLVGQGVEPGWLPPGEQRTGE